MDIIVFGAGKAGKNAMPFLESKYHILFYVDNDEKKWESAFGNYEVKSPNEIKKYDCAVVSVLGRFSLEIFEQLEQMGVGRERIYFCNRLFEIYPSKMPLIQYDLCHAEERETDCKKVLIFCRSCSVYAKQLIENISKRYDDIEFSLLTCNEENKEKIVSERLKHIYYFQTMVELQMILEQLPVYDAMQLLWIEKEWVYFHKLIRSKTKRLNLNIGGSDFYRAGKTERDYKKKLIECADQVIGQTADTVKNFELYYNEVVSGKLCCFPYGIEVLDFINLNREQDKNKLKRKYHIPLNKIVITCGHNASQAHQHIEMIEAINQLPAIIKKQIVCVLPMTYPQGCEEYINFVDGSLKGTDLEYVILKDFMDFQDMAEYALISDIMIHVQTTDQLSSSILEEMYAGSIFIAGSWLPYKALHKMGIYFLDVDTIPDVTAVLEDVVANIEVYTEKCRGNREIIWKYSSWDEVASKWHALWE